MAIKNKLVQDFLEGIEEIKKPLLILQIKPISFKEEGFAYFVQYQRGKTIIEFLFGPSDWDVEMIIYTPNGKFAFRDLLRIPDVAKWVDENRYKQDSVRNVKDELRWFVELLKISLPKIE